MIAAEGLETLSANTNRGAHAQLLEALRPFVRAFPFLFVAFLVIWLLPRRDFQLNADDYLIRAAVNGSNHFGHLGPEGANHSLWQRISNTFHFFSGELGTTQRLKEYGALPWWTDDAALVRMFRPLAGFSHWIDFQVLGGNPWLLQVHSLLWFLLMAMCSWWLYRKHFGVSYTSALAASMFVIDLNHLSNFAWLAGRNAYMAALFGICAIALHSDWRGHRRQRSAVLSCAAILAAMLCAEAGVAALAYLLAYALILDRGGPIRGLLAILPAAAVVVTCRFLAQEVGFGAANVGLYLDPLRSPLAFIGSVTANGPVLLVSAATAISSSLPSMSDSAATEFRWINAAIALVILLILQPVARRDRAAAFFAVGALLAVVPYCALASNTSRSTTFVAVGFFGALAACVRRWLAGERKGIAALAGLVATTVVICWHVLVPAAAGVAHSLTAMRPAKPTPPGDLKYSLVGASGQGIVYLNYPSAVNAMFLPFTWDAEGIAMPAAIYQLTPGLNSYTVERTSGHGYVARSDSIFVLNQNVPLTSASASASAAPPRRSPLYAMRATQAFVTNPERRYAEGQTIKAGAMTITIARVVDGMPQELRVEFDSTVDPDRLAWRLWNWKTFQLESVPPPAIGTSLRVLNAWDSGA